MFRFRARRTVALAFAIVAVTGSAAVWASPVDELMKKDHDRSAVEAILGPAIHSDKEGRACEYKPPSAEFGRVVVSYDRNRVREIIFVPAPGDCGRLDSLRKTLGVPADVDVQVRPEGSFRLEAELDGANVGMLGVGSPPETGTVIFAYCRFELNAAATDNLEASIPDLLREIVLCEGTWKRTDPDRNAIRDYWTADLSGLHRVEARGADVGEKVDLIHADLAAADARPAAGGAAVAPAKIPGAGASSAGLLALARRESKFGYWFAAVPKDPDGSPYALDPDGDGHAWTNNFQFAFCAWPAEYGKTGRRTYIVDTSGVVFAKDLGSAGPVEKWPAADPLTQGWDVVGD